eukprot:gnl/TRDRNA2_/TRDRNA2_193395_c0_seq1.p1 gnl/TRDRNA2_/TRDRNA2_193395_c0~~gnl/TRDRNA2_/TRDRNA2_193395_c0_seq1.p1  ORF type:complete len:119 (-),score=24.99 gnl/TRDRNA2_/TRDRNA2_193395_c0_seq1:78-434(-)
MEAYKAWKHAMQITDLEERECYLEQLHPSDPEYSLRITPVSGDELVIEGVRSHMLLYRLRNLVGLAFGGIAGEEVRLCLGTQMLCDDNKTLEDYGITDSSVLTCVHVQSDAEEAQAVD